MIDNLIVAMQSVLRMLGRVYIGDIRQIHISHRSIRQILFQMVIRHCGGMVSWISISAVIRCAVGRAMMIGHILWMSTVLRMAAMLSMMTTPYSSWRITVSSSFIAIRCIRGIHGILRIAIIIKAIMRFESNFWLKRIGICQFGQQSFIVIGEPFAVQLTDSMLG